MRLEKAVGIDDIRTIARGRLPRFAFDIVDGAADDEVTYRANRNAFEDIVFRPRPLVDVSERDLSVSVFDQRLRIPVILSPSGAGRMAHPDAELGVARAAADFGTIYTLGTVTAFTLDAVAKQSKGALWFQLYVPRDEERLSQVIGEVAAAGYRAVVVTIDTSVHGNRERDRHHNIRPPIRPTPRLIADLLSHPGWSTQFLRGSVTLPARRAVSNTAPTQSSLGEMQAAILEAAFLVTWERLALIRHLWDGPLLVKGIMRSDECGRLIDQVGVDGIIVSNHGGRQLDGLPATISVLPSVVKATEGQIPVFIDGGFRRGTDVVKALALGATACLVGRPWLYGLAAGGERGVERVLEIFEAEIDRAVALLGCRSIDDLGPDVIQMSARLPSEDLNRRA